MEKNGFFDDIGIYFRLDNDESGAEFNNLIKEKSYNKQLDLSTNIVGVQNGKIPKFFLKSDWKPMSVLELGVNLQHGKTLAYSNRADLIISYSDSKPLGKSWLSN